MTTSATVFVVDDDPEIRTLYTNLLESVHLQVRVFSSADEFLRVYNSQMPGCLVLDVRMPGMSGLELQEKLRQQNDPIPILFVTGFADVSMVVKAMSHGAVDFMEKPFRPQELIDCIHDAIAQDVKSRKKKRELDRLMETYIQLTRREKAVTDLIVEGMTNKQIAGHFGVTTQAIDACRGRAMKKLQVDSIAELVRHAYTIKTSLL